MLILYVIVKNFFLVEKRRDPSTFLRVLLPGCATFVFVCVAVFGAIWCIFSKKKSIVNASPVEVFSVELHSLKFLHEGNSTCLFCGSFGKTPVLIKYFKNNLQFMEVWKREKELYTLPIVKHSNILNLVSSQYEGFGNSLCLIFQCEPIGLLYDFLKHNSINLKEFIDLSLSAVSGLSHLHLYISNQKPVISHRDINSRHFIVKADMTCALCLSEFAMVFDCDEVSHETVIQV